jgi:predicted chitinase
MNEYGITNPYMQQALMGVVMAEGGIGGKSENSWRDTPNDRIREYFGARVADTTDSQLTKLKKNDAEFFDKIYGPSAMDYYENIQGWDPGNNKKGDGYKYRGRGLNQLTFKSSYAKMQKDLKKRGYDYDLVKHPELLDTDTDLQALVAVNFLESRLSQIPKLVKNNPNTYGNLTGYQNYNDNITSFEDASYLLTRANAGWGKKVMPEIHDKKLKAAKNYKWDTDYTALADYKENQRLAAEAKEYNRVMDSRSSVPVDPTNLYQAPSGPRQEEYFDQDRMDGMMKSKLAYANEFGNPAAKRMVAPTDQPYNFVIQELIL